MANAFRKSTMVWEVNSVAALTAVSGASSLKNVWVKRIVYVPNSAGNQVTFQDYDGTTSTNAIVLKAGATDTSPITIWFDGKGKRIYGLKCSAISSGSDLAYVYLA
jgi:hypothetical protein